MSFSTIYRFLRREHFCGTVFIVSSFLHKLPLFHLEICFAACVRFLPDVLWVAKLESWIRAWTGQSKAANSSGFGTKGGVSFR